MTRASKFILFGLLLAACGDSATHHVPGDAETSDAGADGSVNSTGGEHDGATSADATQDEAGCACDDRAPVCLEDEGVCVACSPTDQGACRGTTPYCGADNTCVACLGHSDCPADNAPVCRAGSCAGCEEDAECGDGRICDKGHCGECTSARSDACTTGGSAHVCDVLARTCSSALPGSASACENCISDAHCGPNLACVEHHFAGKIVGTFCMPLQGTAACSRPYTEPELAVTTLEGATVNVCIPKLASCPALVGASGYGAPCGVDASGTAVAAGAVRGDDSLCGMKGVDDAVCVEGSRPLDFNCTLACTDGMTRNASLCPAQSHDFPGQAPSCKAGDHYPSADAATAYVCGS